MEAASVPAADAADAQEGQEGTEGTEAQQAQADLTPVLERLDELSRGFGELQPLLQQQRQPEAEAEEDFSLDRVFPDDGFGNQQLDPNALNSYIEQQIQRGISAQEQRVTAVEQRQLDQEWDALAEQYPKLQDPKFAEEIGGEVRRFAQARGVPALAADPEVVEMFYLARDARERAAREVPAGSGEEVHLEGSAASAPGEPETDPDQDIARRMLGAGGNSLWGASPV